MSFFYKLKQQFSKKHFLGRAAKLSYLSAEELSELVKNINGDDLSAGDGHNDVSFASKTTDDLTRTVRKKVKIFFFRFFSFLFFFFFVYLFLFFFFSFFFYFVFFLFFFFFFFVFFLFRFFLFFFFFFFRFFLYFVFFCISFFFLFRFFLNKIRIVCILTCPALYYD